MARHPSPRDDRRDHGQRLARATILCHHAPRRAHVDQSRALRGRRVRWCRRLGPFSLHHAAAAAAGLGGGNPLLHHSHLRRLQHRLRAHSRWPRELHASVRNVRVPGWAPGGEDRRRIGHRTVHVPGARGGRLRAAPLRAEGDLMAIRRYPRFRVILDHAALMVTYPTFLVPFCTWLLMGYFRTIPKEIEECALMDGCNRFQTLLRIVIPVAAPGIICAILFAFTLSWNEFIYALTFTSAADQKTITVGVTNDLIRGDIYYWGSLMAGAVMGSVPIVIIYVLFLDYYVSGLTTGAVK